MRNSLFISILVLLMAAGCRDHVSGDKPVLKLEEIKPNSVPRNSLLKLTFSFDSKLTADSIWIQKVVPDCSGSAFTATFKVPDYPVFSGKGNMTVTFANGFVEPFVDLRSPQCGDNDTVNFKFVLRDIDGNTSDTLTSPQIVILK